MKEQNYIEEEITLKELILKVKELFLEVLKNWLVVVLVPLPFVLFFSYQVYKTPVTYTSELTFMMNDDAGGGAGGIELAVLFTHDAPFGHAGAPPDMGRVADRQHRA